MAKINYHKFLNATTRFICIHLPKVSKAKKLEKEVKQKNFIYSMIGHDLSSPMIDMDMILDHIHTDLKDKLNDKQKNYLNQLRSKAQEQTYFSKIF